MEKDIFRVTTQTESFKASSFGLQETNGLR